MSLHYAQLLCHMTSCDPLPGAVEHQEAVAVCVGLLAKHAADMVSGVIVVCSEAGVNPRQGVNPKQGLIQGRGVHVLCECMVLWVKYENF